MACSVVQLEAELAAHARTSINGRALFFLFSEWSLHDVPALRAFNSEFAATQIQTGSLQTCLFREITHPVPLLAQFLGTLIMSPLMARRIRLCPSEAEPFLVAIAVDLTMSVDQGLMAHPGQLRMLGSASAVALSLVVANLPETFRLSQATISTLKSLMPRVTFCAALMVQASMEHQARNLAVLVSFFTEQITLDACQLALRQCLPRELVFWRYCAAGELGDCPAPVTGDAMRMCAKCQSVRYCCRAHQRAHWKRHKLECFIPVWDT